MTGHISDQAAGLAALPNDDPERVAAYDHASTCPPCRKALTAAERLLSLIDSAPRPEPPSEATMRRAWNTIAAEIDIGPSQPSSEPAGWNARLSLALALAFSALLVLFDARGHALVWNVGVECFLIEIGTAAVAVGVAARIIQNRPGVAQRTAFAALAAWSAAVAQVYLHFRCPVAHEAVHLVLFHAGGVLLAAIFGGPLGARLSRRAA